MLGGWSVGSYREEVWIVPRFGGSPAPAEVTALAPDAAALRVPDWFPEGTRSRLTLLEIVGHLERHLLHGSPPPTSWLLARVGEALRDGRLAAHAQRRTTIAQPSGAAKQAPKPKSEPPAQPKEDKTWIAVQLVDKEGKPVAFKRYSIELPDGAKREGMLDANGTARLEGIDPGSCNVSFPDFDASDWKAA